MTTFLFWNLNRKPLHGLVAEIVRQHSVDVVMLAECLVSPDHVLAALNQTDRASFEHASELVQGKVEIFTGFPAHYVRPLRTYRRISLRNLMLPNQPDILLVAVHLPNKRDWSERSQYAECIELAELVRLEEVRLGHTRTVLVGDLNMNPFEDGLVSANGFHTVASRDVAVQRGRRVQSRMYPFFYNPMWSLFGDATPGPPGTYYYRRSELREFFWHMFDQVLVRPELLAEFENRNLEVITWAGTTSLLTSRGRPAADRLSDHLPLKFSLFGL